MAWTLCQSENENYFHFFSTGFTSPIPPLHKKEKKTIVSYKMADSLKKGRFL
jgi:hypothetical protein